MNGAHLLCTGRFSRPSSEAAWQPGRRAPPHLLSHISGAELGQGGAPGGCPPGHECQPYHVRKGAKRSHCLCSHCTKGKGRRKTVECIPAAERKQSHSGHLILHSEQPTCTDATEAAPSATPPPALHPALQPQPSLYLTSDLCGSTSSVSM